MVNLVRSLLHFMKVRLRAAVSQLLRDCLNGPSQLVFTVRR